LGYKEEKRKMHHPILSGSGFFSISRYIRGGSDVYRTLVQYVLLG